MLICIFVEVWEGINMATIELCEVGRLYGRHYGNCHNRKQKGARLSVCV